MQTRAALLRLLQCAMCCALLVGATYAEPRLTRFRPWVRGENVPVLRVFQDEAELPGFAEAAVHTGRDTLSQLREALGRVVADNLGEGEDDEQPSPPARQRALPAASAGQPASPPVVPPVTVDPQEYEGITRGIENPQALRRFFKRLRRTAEQDAAAVTRVAHYGDSAVAADAITRTARGRLQRRFGDAGHGFILISRGRMHYAHSSVQHRGSRGWEMLSAVRSQLDSGRYGYGGVQARGDQGQQALFGTAEKGAIGRRVSRFELFFQRYPGGGQIALEVDGRAETRRVIDTDHTRPMDDFVTITVPDGPHALRLQVMGNRPVRLYGVAMERDVPGVVYDSLGLVGARAQRLLNADRLHIQQQIAHRAPDLLVLGFGGNEAGSEWLELSRYEQELREVVDVMRAGRPAMDCLLFGPLDQATRNARGRVVTLDKLPRIVKIQREVALDMGCAFFDTYAAMGGRNTFDRWYRSRPQLASADLRHATPEGYKVIGNLYYKALLKAFAQSLK